MFFSRVSVKRLDICGRISDISSLEINVKDEVVFESFIDQNKDKSQHLEKVINRIKNLKPKYTKNLLKRLQNKPKTTDRTNNKKSSKIVTPENPLDGLIDYFLDNIMMEETPMRFRPPIQMNPSQSTFLPLRHLSNVNASNIRSKFQVHLQPLKIPTKFQVHLKPIKVPKGKPCFLVKPLQSKPSMPVHATCQSSYGATSSSRPLPLEINIHSVASNLQQ